MFLTVFSCGDNGVILDGDMHDDSQHDILLEADAALDEEKDQGSTDAIESADDVQDKEELVFPDLIEDKIPPEVISTFPGNEMVNIAIPFVVKVKFSEKIRKETIDNKTFFVKDVNGNKVAGEFSFGEDDSLVTFTPDKDAPILLASPYTVTLTTIIQDMVGNKLKGIYNLTFSTVLPASLEKYGALAAKYAPIIYQATYKDAPHYDYLTRFDFDGDWAGKNNVDSLKKATKLESHVYYDVIESKSHYYITYLFFYPYRYAEYENQRFGNDTSGSMVVVRKYPDEKPVAVMNYFASTSYEYIRSYVTSESGIVGEKGKDYYGVNWEFPEAQLFPQGRFLSYLSSRSHQSCLWNHTTKENALDVHCQLNEGIKGTMTKIRYLLKDGMAQAIEKTQGKFPAELDNVGYALRYILGEWWVRRSYVDPEKMFALTYTYEPHEGRPGKGLIAPNTFVDPIGDKFGRPQWAWVWTGEPYNFNMYVYEMPRGMFFLDPAYFFTKRHRLEKPFDPVGKTGYSLEYCFNPYLMIDQRNSADCK